MVPSVADSSPWPGRVYEGLFERRIVMAHGELDDEAATSLCAQLLTLDAERIRADAGAAAPSP
jgi:ATP-dependent protease ClpP protease subunit